MTDYHQEMTSSEVNGRSENAVVMHPNYDAVGSDDEDPMSRPSQALPLLPENCTVVQRIILEKLWELHDEMNHLIADVQQELCERLAQDGDHPPSRDDYSLDPRSRPSRAFPLNPENFSAVERIMLEKLWKIQDGTSHLMALMQTLCERPQDLPPPSRGDYDQKLPIATLEGLNSFDESIQRDANFKRYMISKLSMVGGATVRKMVWHVCTKVFAPELAMQLYWRGRGAKTGIKSRPILRILLLSVLQQHRTTEYDIEEELKYWLRLSRNRRGGNRREGRHGRVEPQPQT